MARYTNLFSTPDLTQSLQQSLAAVLESCDLDLVYEANDYLVAQEKPGQVSHNKLATVEVLINPPTSNEPNTKVNLVVKNEELPLKAENHCQQVFDFINQAISSSSCCTFA